MIPKYLEEKLQHIQASAQKLISGNWETLSTHPDYAIKLSEYLSSTNLEMSIKAQMDFFGGFSVV